jgi:uncharacterized membrane protein YhaH (DUF805 family)
MIYFEPFKKFATFSGRAGRKEYWTFFLGSFAIIMTLVVIESFAIAFFGIDADPSGKSILATAYKWLVMLPLMAVTVRRLHDVGESGWWLLLYLVPLVGGLVMLAMLLGGSQDDNKYGAAPGDIVRRGESSRLHSP